MRGPDEQTQHMFSYLSPEQRVPADHPLRAVRALTDEALRSMSEQFERLYSTTGRPSIPPEQLLLSSDVQSYALRRHPVLRSFSFRRGLGPGVSMADLCLWRSTGRVRCGGSPEGDRSSVPGGRGARGPRAPRSGWRGRGPARSIDEDGAEAMIAGRLDA